MVQDSVVFGAESEYDLIASKWQHDPAGAPSMTEVAEARNLPDYDRPPVVETVVGIQFDQVSGLSTARLAAFWAALDQEEWPTATDAALLAAQIERFDEASSSSWAKGVQFRMMQQYPGCRVQIKNRSGDRMIQLQNGRFHFNWLGKSGGEYPRYKSVRNEFAALWAKFCEFISRAHSPGVRPNQWEVTYVNQIPRGTVWSGPADWSFFKPLGAVPTIPGTIEGESFGGEWHFVISPQRGRLHIAWQHGREQDEGKQDPSQELIRLTLTARGPVETRDDPTAAILDGLDLGRETIVRSFQQFMGDAANRYWGLKHA